MDHEPTAFHKPIDLASRRAARATRRIRAGRCPSDFMPLDYASDPAEHQPIEGGGVPVWVLISLAAVFITTAVLIVLGVRSLLTPT